MYELEGVSSLKNGLLNLVSGVALRQGMHQNVPKDTENVNLRCMAADSAYMDEFIGF